MADDSYLSKIKLGTFSEEFGHVKKFFSLNKWQYMVMLGVAVSGLAAFVNTYNAWSGINAATKSCTENPDYEKKINTQVIVLIILAVLAIILGAIIAWLLRNLKNTGNIVTLGIITAGIFGIIYAISRKFQNATDRLKLGISWVSFFAFIIIGFIMSAKKDDSTSAVISNNLLSNMAVSNGTLGTASSWNTQTI